MRYPNPNPNPNPWALTYLQWAPLTAVSELAASSRTPRQRFRGFKMAPFLSPPQPLAMLKHIVDAKNLSLVAFAFTPLAVLFSDDGFLSLFCPV